MSVEFVHLHVHSQYSLLDGALRVKDLASRARSLGMSSVALTDHGNMFGILQHYLACKEQGLSAILGCEVNVARPRPEGFSQGGSGVASNRSPAAKGPAKANASAELGEDLPVDHLVLLAASAEGYQNLARIVSAGHLEPVSSRAPSVLLDTIARNNKGLIGLSGCLGGVAAQQVLEQGEAAGRASLERLKEVFEPGGLYVELQDHGLPEQPVVNGILARAARELDLRLVATNDVHFVNRDDGESQLFLSCIAQNRVFADAHAQHHGSYEMFLKSPIEMAHAMSDHPEALRETLAIAERCTSFKLKLNEPMLPNFVVPEGFDAPGYFRHVSKEGLERRFLEVEQIGQPVDRELYRARLASELDVICKMKFPGYFLIVWDFIRYAKDNGIPVGPGRGSGAGSLVAWALRITDLDPIPYNLLFERFLNPERVSMPDFDIDFCMDRRDEVIAYVAQKYGARSVGQIATFHELKSRSVIKDVARTMALPPIEAQRIASLVPQKAPGIMYTIPEALEVEPKLKALVASDPTVAELIKQAMKLEGLTRHAGMHAAGVVISEGPLDDHVPCFKNGDQIVTQYHKDDVEKAGLVKFDFLGLKTLTVIDIAEKLVNARPDRQGPGTTKFNVTTLPLTDVGTYQLLQTGETTGVFQLESNGMQQLFKDLKPDAFEDIVAAVALYRPGPLGTGMVKDFVECKHGKKPIEKMHPLVDDLLKPTYGVIVYQEQVMQIAQKLAGYTLGGADLLRRAMGKKKAEEMAKQKATFVDGAATQGVSNEDAERIFALLEFFAGYGFNKSHSAAYALLTYQTAYLKAHYPVEFLCALMTADRDKIEKVVRIIAEGRAWGVETLPPEINESKINFTVVYTPPSEDGPVSRGKTKRERRLKDPYQPKIRFGMGAIRGVGESALEAVLEAREEGPFTDLFDFAERIDARRVNRGVLEALVASGSLDTSLSKRGVTRAQAFEAIERALERSRNASKDRERGQTSLFGLMVAPDASQSAPFATTNEEYPAVEPWDLRETLVREKEALGFYVSGHPLNRYGIDLARFDVVPTSILPDRENWAKVRIAGMVEGYRAKIFKGGGGKLAFFSLEDQVGRVEVKVRERQIDAYESVLVSKEPVLLSGKLSFPQVEEGEDEPSGPREPTLLLDEAVLLTDAIRSQARGVTLRLSAARHRPEQLERLRAIMDACPGACSAQLTLELEGGSEVMMALPQVRVEPNDAFFAQIEKLLGGRVIELR